MTDDEQNCAELLRTQDPERFLAAMTAPLAQRGALMVVYAFNLEVARAPWASKEEMLAEMRLQWWLDQVGETYDGGKVSPHMVMTPLGELVRRHGLPREVLEAMITARRWEIYREPHADMAAFERFIDNTAGGVLQMAVRVLGQGGDLPDAKVLAAHGFGRGVAAWLRAVPALEQYSRVPLLDRSEDAMRVLAKRALHASQNVRPILRRSDKCYLPALRSGWTAPVILRKAMAEPSRVLQGGLVPSGASARLSLMWKTMVGGF
ncbi:MAG: squalene/phytoene synthase family protein [Rhodobacteraceae bacterium]|nr:squalene/phytoene synthase family protein [Paracoccaceae bacterium]